MRKLQGLHRRIFGAPERWATAMMGTAPIGGPPTTNESSCNDADYRLVRRPSRHFFKG
jgi:hypothetical protein